MARGLRDVGCLAALAGTWILLEVALVTARRGWGPDAGGLAAYLLGAIGLGFLVLGLIILVVGAYAGSVTEELHVHGAASGPTSRLRAAVATGLVVITLARGVYVAVVWGRVSAQQRAQERRSDEQIRRQKEDLTQRVAIWDANQTRLREGLRRCLAAAEPPAGVRLSGVSVAQRERLETALREKLPAYRILSDREVLCIRSVAFPDRLPPDGDELVTALAVTGRFEGDGAEETVALATKSDALELYPVLFRPGVPPLLQEGYGLPGQPAVLLGCVRGVPRNKPSPPKREDHWVVYDEVVSAFLERPYLLAPAQPGVQLRWMRVEVSRGIDGKEYVQFGKYFPLASGELGKHRGTEEALRITPNLTPNRSRVR
jgi:hypothetical protein